MDFEIDDVKNMIPKIREGKKPLVYTENFLEKIEHRNIDDDEFVDCFLNSPPKYIKKMDFHKDFFELCFGWDGEHDIVVITEMMQSLEIALYTAFLRRCDDGGA